LKEPVLAHRLFQFKGMKSVSETAACCESIGFANSLGTIKIDLEIILSEGNKNEN